MTSFLAIAMLTCTAVAPEDDKGHGFLYEPAFALEYNLTGKARPYEPQPGDMFMSTDNMGIIQWGHNVSGAKAPHHSGIVIRKPDGQYCVLEAGPHNSLTIKVLDLNFSLSSYQSKGVSVWIRRRSVPLTQDQANRLAEFAMAQDGKRFALGRMLAQITPFSSRKLLWTGYTGHPHGGRDSFWCAELVLETCLYAGILDPNRIHPCCTYPSELFFGRSAIPAINETLNLNDFWEAPAPWSASLPQPAVPVPPNIAP